MNTNKKVSVIDDFIAGINEAKNTLSYTLFLPVPSSEFKKDDNIKENPIDSIVDFTYEKCSPFLNDYQFTLYGSKENNCPNLSALAGQSAFWKRLFKQDAILSCFVILRKLFGESCPLTNYSYIKLKNMENTDMYTLLSGNFNYGLDFLFSERKLELKMDNGAYNLYKNYSNTAIAKDAKQKKRDINEIYSSSASNLESRIKLLNKKLNSEFNFSELYNRPSDQCKFHLIEFYDRLLWKRKNDTPPIINTMIKSRNTDEHTFIKSTHQNYLQCVNDLIKDLNIPGYSIKFTKNVSEESEEKTYRMRLSDKIYLLYQIESVFAPIAINCMYQNVKQCNTGTILLDDQAVINRLSSFMKLPNVFSRSYILQMFTDTIKYNTLKELRNDSFFRNYKIDPNAVVTLVKNYKDQEDSFIFYNLLSNYSTFVSYLETFFFPLYESYVFCSLWNYIEQIHNELTPTGRLIEMYKLLMDYLNDEKLVEKLFSIENISEYSFLATKLRKDVFRTPDFSDDATTDSSVYQRCIKGKKSLSLDGNIPTFINKEYILSFKPMLEKQIQTQYILASIDE